MDIGNQIDNDSISYHRLVTHLQFFAQRVIDGNSQGEGDSFLYEQVKKNYPESMQTAKKLKRYIETSYHFPVENEELIYLTIHIQRVKS